MMDGIAMSQFPGVSRTFTPDVITLKFDDMCGCLFSCKTCAACDGTTQSRRPCPDCILYGRLYFYNDPDEITVKKGAMFVGFEKGAV